MPRAIVVAMLLVVAACPRSDEHETTEPTHDSPDSIEAHRRGIEAAVAGYVDALMARDPASASMWVTSNTFAYYDLLHELALSGKRSELEGRGLLEIVMVLDVRARFTRAQLEQNDGRALFDDAIVIGMDASRPPLDDLRIDEAAGRAEVHVDGRPVLWLTREQGRWLIDVPALARAVSPEVEAEFTDAIIANGKLRVAYIWLEDQREGMDVLDIAILDGPLDVVP